MCTDCRYVAQSAPVQFGCAVGVYVAPAGTNRVVDGEDSTCRFYTLKSVEAKIVLQVISGLDGGLIGMALFQLLLQYFDSFPVIVDKVLQQFDLLLFRFVNSTLFVY